MTTETGLALLREPFPEHQISHLPKGGVMLAYVGHAALTDRLLTADPTWTWEPLALDERGLPALDDSGGLWIRLTVCGITRIGYGDAGQKKGGDAMKERIGDALRNAAMRFGAALELWHKGELHAPEPLTEDEIATMLAGIENAKTVADAKSATEAAREIAAHDPAALARIDAAVEAKRAAFVKARPKRETEVTA
ncbi:MAG: hypothetical protein QG590_1805 [Pseudomonadota bacterium]|jgi:hypothetical protein|nr:hypothetical protein [Pseudomonadota bacterium]